MSSSSSMLSEQNQPELKKITNCIVLAGPCGTACDSELISKRVDALKAQGCTVTLIGDGEKNLSAEHLEELYNKIKSSTEHTLLFIDSHGSMIENEHYTALSKDYGIKSVDLLRLITANLNNQPIDIISKACDGSRVCEYAPDILPVGSHYMGFSYGDVFDSGIRNLAQTLEMLSSAVSNLSAQSIFNIYLTKSLYVRSGIPMIPTICSKEKTSSLVTELKLKEGNEFTIKEKSSVFKELSAYVTPEILDQTMDKIKNNQRIEIGSKEYGIALAIAHVTSKKLPALHPLSDSSSSSKSHSKESKSTNHVADVMVHSALEATAENVFHEVAHTVPGLGVVKPFLPGVSACVDLMGRSSHPKPEGMLPTEHTFCASVGTLTKFGSEVAIRAALIGTAPETGGLSLLAGTGTGVLGTLAGDSAEKLCTYALGRPQERKESPDLRIFNRDLQRLLDPIAAVTPKYPEQLYHDSKNSVESKSTKYFHEAIRRKYDPSPALLPAKLKLDKNDKDTRDLLKEHGIRWEDLPKPTQAKLKNLVENFNDQEQKTQKEHEQRKRVLQNVHHARGVFSGIQQLGIEVKESNPSLGRALQMVGTIGERGFSIAENAMNLTGRIPGMAEPTGIEKLFPMANIGIASASIIFSLLSRKKSQSSGPDPLQESLKAIFEQIGALRKEIQVYFREMHARFDHVDEQLEQINNKLIEIDRKFERLEAMLTNNYSSLQEVMTVSFDRLGRDIDALTEITRSGLAATRLDDYKKVRSRILDYIEGEAKPDDSVTHINEFERNWLLENFCEGMFTGMYHSSYSYRQISKIADINVGIILGYLAHYAKEKLGLKQIRETGLPNMPLWMEGVNLALAARFYLKQRDQKDLNSERLKAMKTKATAAIQFIDVLEESIAPLYKMLFSIYTDGLKSLNEKITEVLIQEETSRLATSSEPLSKIQLSGIKPIAEQKECNVLESKHFLDKLKDVQVPSILMYAQTLGFASWTASYQGAKTQAQAYHAGGGWQYDFTTIRAHAMPLYYINLGYSIDIFKKTLVSQYISVRGLSRIVMSYLDSEHDIQVLNVSFKKHIGNSQWQMTAGYEAAAHYNLAVDDQSRANFVVQQNAISISSLTLSHWMTSTVHSEVKFDSHYAIKIGSYFPGIEVLVRQAWNAAKADETPENFKKSIQGLKAKLTLFEEMINQLKAARVLCHAYSQLLGFDISIINKIDDCLVTNLDHLLDNPHLFNKTIANISELLKMIESISLRSNESKSLSSSSSSSKGLMSHDVTLSHSSSIRQKFLVIFNFIESFEEHLNHAYVYNSKHHIDRSIDGYPIEWSQVVKGKKLSSGGFGDVYEGYLLEDEVPIAMKIMRFSDEKTFDEKSFKREVEILSKCQSDYIIKTYGHTKNPETGESCLIMELAKGGALNNFLATKKGNISKDQKIKLIIEIARGLCSLHLNGIIHGDIKSLNILLNDRMHPKISDFGLAKTRESAISSQMTGVTRTTKRSGGLESHATQVWGSLLWQAPETLGEDEYKPTCSADVYSFGVIVWEILTESTPFQEFFKMKNPTIAIQNVILGATLNDKKYSRVKQQPISTNVPDELKNLIYRCWEQDPEKRPSMQDIVCYLQKTFSDMCATLPPFELENKKFSLSSTSSSSTPSTSSTSFSVPQLLFARASSLVAEQKQLYIQRSARKIAEFCGNMAYAREAVHILNRRFSS